MLNQITRTMNIMAREDLAAALQLCSWKHLDLDPQTALELEQEKQYVLPPPNHSNNEQILQYVLPRPPSPNRRYFLLEAVVHGLVGECSPSWEKQLTESDLLGTQTRLLLQQGYVRNHLYPLLTCGELYRIKNGGIVVNVYDWRGNIYEMDFKLWGTKAHVLTNSNWLRFAGHHNLVEDEDWITLWMFKHVITRQICYAIFSERETSNHHSCCCRRKRKRVDSINQCNSLKRIRKNDGGGI